jgi:hypothetical protein
MRIIRNATPKILQCNPPYDLSHRHDDGRASGKRNEDFEIQVGIRCRQYCMGQASLKLASISMLDSDVLVGGRDGVLPARKMA